MKGHHPYLKAGFCLLALLMFMAATAMAWTSYMARQAVALKNENIKLHSEVNKEIGGIVKAGEKDLKMFMRAMIKLGNKIYEKKMNIMFYMSPPGPRKYLAAEGNRRMQNDLIELYEKLRLGTIRYNDRLVEVVQANQVAQIDLKWYNELTPKVFLEMDKAPYDRAMKRLKEDRLKLKKAKAMQAKMMDIQKEPPETN
jgi:hypothetical protein